MKKHGIIVCYVVLFVTLIVHTVHSQVLQDVRMTSSNSTVQQFPEKVKVAPPALWVAAYYPTFAYCDLLPQQIDYKAITHLIIFASEPSTTYPYMREMVNATDSATLETGVPGWCYNPASNNNTNGITHQSIMRDSCRANGVKFILCLGGEIGTNANNMNAIIADSVKQDAYIAAVMGYVNRHGFNGIDIDLEYPVPAQKALYGRFLRKFRVELDKMNPRGVLSMAVDKFDYTSRMAVSDANATVDQINIMQYGMGEASYSGYNAPMARPNVPNYTAWTIADHGPALWKSLGYDSTRIGMLIPFECKYWTGVDGPGQTQVGYPGFTSYIDVLNAIKANTGSVPTWDAIAKVPGFGYTSGGVKHWYSYEDSNSIPIKVQYARDQHIGGVGVWELWRGWIKNNPVGQRDPLLQSLKKAIGGFVPQLDTTKPTVSIVAPLNGTAVSGIVTITVNASDNVGVTKVDFKVNGTTVGTDFSTPFSYSWVTIGLTGGQTLTAVAYDAAGNQATSATITVTVVPPPPPMPRIKGQLFYDKNNNGRKDSDEPGMPGWTIRLSGSLVASVLTDSIGNYSFDVPSGVYVVSEDRQPLWSQTKPVTSPLYSVILNDTSAGFTGDFGNYSSLVRTIEMNKNWNIISLPLNVPDPSTSSLIPMAQSGVFSYQGAYAPVDTLTPGNGYWMRIANAQTVYLAGSSLVADTIPLINDWNLIGSISSPISTVSVTTNPPGIISTKFFGFESGFISADTIEPGKGYWVKSSQAGSLILSSSSVQVPGSAISSFDPSLLNFLTFTNASGIKQKIYFAFDDNVDRKLSSLYGLPPPMDGIFDVRFQSRTPGSSGTMVSVASIQQGNQIEMPIKIQSAQYPVIVEWNILSNELTSQLDITPSESYTLSNHGTMTIADAGSGDANAPRWLSLHLTKDATSSLPSQYGLLQNYPNPFNPTTSIELQLPNDSYVKLDVYNILGVKVASLIDGMMKAGSQKVVFDGMKLASGVYIYKMEARASSTQEYFKQVKRMLLLK